MGRVFKRRYRDKKTGELRECATYTLEFYVNGRKVREPTETRQKENAKTLLREREQSLWEGRYFPRSRSRIDLTVGTLRDNWLDERKGKLSLRHDKARLGSFVDHVGEHRVVASLATTDVIGWRASLEKRKLEVATINRHLAVLRSALNLAAEQGHAHRDPMRGIRMAKERNERDRICSPAEFAKLYEEAEEEIRALVVIGYELGMRLGEIVGLRRDRVDLEAGTVRLRAADTKEAAPKVLVLPASVVKEMKEIPARRARFFHHTTETYSRKFAELAAELKIEDLRFHDLRHTAASRMHAAGVDLLIIQAFTGHKTLAMLKRYTRVTPDTMRRALEKVEAHEASDLSKR